MIILERPRHETPVRADVENPIPVPADLYVLCLACLAVCLLLVGWSQHVVRHGRELALFGMLAAAAGSQKLWVPNSPGSRLSIGYVFVIVSMLILPLPEAMLIAAASGLSGSLLNVSERPRLREGVFNTSSLVLSAALAGQILQSLGHPVGAMPTRAGLLPILVAASLYVVTNAGLAAVFVALAEERPVWQVWRQSLRWTGAAAAAGACLAILMAVAYSLPGRMLFYLSLPLAYVLFAAYQATLERMVESRQHVEDVDQSARVLFHAYQRVGQALAAPLDAGALRRLIVDLSQEIMEPQMSGLCLQREGELELSDIRFAATFPAARAGEVAEALQKGAAAALERGQPTSTPTDSLRSGSPGAIMFAVPLLAPDGIHGALCALYEPWSQLTDARRQFLTGFVAQAAHALGNAHLFQRELDAAASMRQSLLPPERVVAPHLEVGAYHEPLVIDAARIGGDYYDLMTLPDGRSAVSVADVCGKGMEAAVRTAFSKYTVRAYATETPWPSQVLARTNAALAVQEEDLDRFTTLSYVLLDPVGGTLSLAAAGHPPALLYRAATGRCVCLEVVGAALGVLPDTPYEEVLEAFEPNDLLLLYTDGILEARQGIEQFGLERLSEAFVRAAGEPPSEIAAALVAAAREFAGGAFSDDVTLLVLKNSRGGERSEHGTGAPSTLSP